MKGKKKEEFDYQSFEEQALKAMYEGKSLEQALGPLLKRLVEAGLQGEMQAHLEEEKAAGAKNRRNCKTGKSVCSSSKKPVPSGPKMGCVQIFVSGSIISTINRGEVNIFGPDALQKNRGCLAQK